MQLSKYFVVFVALIGRLCESKLMIDLKELDRPVKLEDAALKTLINCYANHDKTVVVLGDFPGNAYKRLSSYRLFSLVLMNDRKRAETINRNFDKKNPANEIRKVNIVVATASYHKRMNELFFLYLESRYYTATTAYLALGWSAQNKHAMCDGTKRTLRSMTNFDPQLVLNVKMMCRHRTKEILFYNSNWYTNEIPEPWKVVKTAKLSRGGPNFHMLEQQYREHVQMCKNLDFDKTRDLGGTPIQLIVLQGITSFYIELCNNPYGKPLFVRGIINLLKKNFHYFLNFYKYVNATVEIVEEPRVVGNGFTSTNWKAIEFRGSALSAAVRVSNRPYAYPFEIGCRTLLTQFRGNKSQLGKIRDVIDTYSWISMYVVYIVTLIFFKFVLRQPIMIGILNLVRLTSNNGLTTTPSGLVPQIYLTCLFFCVVTVQGIFVSNLAALLTQNIPERQVNSLQDLIDLGYTIYADEIGLNYFDHPALKGRVVMKLTDEDCISIVRRDPLVACVYGGRSDNDVYAAAKLYVSSDCVFEDYHTNLLPFYWILEQRYNEFMAIMFAADTLAPLDAMVDEKRMSEFRLQEIAPSPRVINLNDLIFAFVILGIGLTIAFVTFIGELMVYRFQHRVRKTRIIVLN